MDSFDLEGRQYFQISCPSPLLSHNKPISGYKEITPRRFEIRRDVDFLS